MSSMYFAPSNKGYVQRPIEGETNIDSGKRIPVYKVVSEFMNYQPRQIQKRTIKEVDEEYDYHEHLKLAKLQKSAPPKQSNKVLINSASCRVQRSQEDGSECLQENNRGLMSKRQFSLKDTSISHLDSPDKNNIKISIIESQIIKNQQTKITDRITLSKEIQRQRRLRNNLQQSYLLLLQRLNQNQMMVIKKQPINRYKNHRYTEIQEPKDSEKQQRSSRPKSKTETSVQDQNEDEVQSAQDIYCEHLQRQKQFQLALLQEIEGLHNRIEQLQNLIIEEKSKAYSLKITQHKNSNEANIACPNNSKTKMRKLHHIFLLFVMFLIVAMALKSKQK